MRTLLLLAALSSPALAQDDPEPTRDAEPLASEWEAVEDTGSASAEPAADGQPAAETTAPDESGPEYELVDLLGGVDQLPDVQKQVVDTLVAANPALADHQATVQEWARRYLDWETMREGMAKVYRDYFTAAEIEELLTFYRSATGRKTVLLMPTLFREGSRIGMKLAEAHKTELVEMIRRQAPAQSTP